MWRIAREASGLLGLLLLLASCAPPEVEVTEEEFGGEWPFTVSSGVLTCRGPAWIFATDGGAYALNAAAKFRGYLAIDLILDDDPEKRLGKKSLDPVLDRASSLCG